MRVLVLGAGVAGLLAAVELSSLGAAVDVVDPKGLGAGATSRSAGILSLQMPDPLLGWVMESLEYYQALGVAERAPGLLVAPVECVEELRSLASRGVEVVELDSGEAARLSGVEVRIPEGWTAAYTVDALVDVAALLNKLSSRLPRPPRTADVNPYKALSTGYDAVVIAAGAWSPRLLGVEPEAMAGSAIYNCEASSVSVRGSLTAILYTEGAGYAYAAPEAPGRAIVGDGPNRILGEPEDSRPEPGSVYEVLETLSRVYPAFLEAYPVSSWSAPCLIAGDGLPLVGEWVDGIYVLTGLDGYGLMVAPHLARMLARHILDGAPLPAFLDPHREVEPWRGAGEPPEPFRGCGGLHR